MKQKHIIVLACILIALVLLVIFKKSQPSSVVQSESSPKLNFSIDRSKITDIKIKKSDTEIEIKKDNGVWVVPGRWGAKADEGKIKQFFDVLSELHGERRSSKKELWADYQIQDDEAFQIDLLKQDGSSEKVYIGAVKPGGYGVFLRVNDSSDVYFSPDQLLPNLGIFGDIKSHVLKPDFWLELRLISLESDEVNSISLTEIKNGQSNLIFNLEKVAESDHPEILSWKTKDMSQSFTVDEAKVKEYLNKFQFQRAKAIADPAVQYGLDNPDFKLTVGRMSNGEKVINFKKADDKTSDYVVLVSDEPEIKLITSGVVNVLKVTADFFKQADAVTA